MAEKYPDKLFGTFIDRNYRIIRLSFLKAFKEAKVDITTEQWVILDALYNESGLAQNQLAKLSYKDAPTTSRIIDKLEEKGFAKRKPSKNDRRAQEIIITQKGKKAHQKLIPIVKNLRAKGWESLSDKDYSTFIKIMNQIFQNFE